MGTLCRNCTGTVIDYYCGLHSLKTRLLEISLSTQLDVDKMKKHNYIGNCRRIANTNCINDEQHGSGKEIVPILQDSSVEVKLFQGGCVELLRLNDINIW